MGSFFEALGDNKSRKIRLAVMDMWKPFRNACAMHAPGAAILYDKFHALRHLGDVLDKVRRTEYARLKGEDRKFIKGQRYTLLSHRENLSLDGKKALRTLLKANKRLETTYCSRSLSANCGTTAALPGRGSSSRTGATLSKGRNWSSSRNSPG